LWIWLDQKDKRKLKLKDKDLKKPPKLISLLQL
jgi:hypothetical protein